MSSEMILASSSMSRKPSNVEKKLLKLNSKGAETGTKQILENSEGMFDHSKEAGKFFETLENVCQIVKGAKKETGLKAAMKKTLQPWKETAGLFTRTFSIQNKVQFLPFNVMDMFKDLSEQQLEEIGDELYIKNFYIDWTPYISANLRGLTTVYLADFRSTKWHNILQTGYVFPSGRPIKDMAMSPGYHINLKDKQVDRIFKLLVITSDLDLREQSMFGKLTLTAEYFLNDSKRRSMSIRSTGMVLYAHKDAYGILSKTDSPQQIILKEIDVEDIRKTYLKELESAQLPISTFDDHTEISDLLVKGSSKLERSMSMKSLDTFNNSEREFDRRKSFCVDYQSGSDETRKGPSESILKAREVLYELQRQEDERKMKFEKLKLEQEIQLLRLKKEEEESKLREEEETLADLKKKNRGKSPVNDDERAKSGQNRVLESVKDAGDKSFRKAGVIINENKRTEREIGTRLEDPNIILVDQKKLKERALRTDPNASRLI